MGCPGAIGAIFSSDRNEAIGTTETMATTTPMPAAAREPNVIYEGDTVICQTSDGRMFFQDMRKDQYVVMGAVDKLVIML